MEAVYYYDKATSLCPVKQYLSDYQTTATDTAKVKQRREKILADIDQKIQHIIRSNGLPTPPISKPLHGYSFFEIRTRKDKNILIRIHYFRHRERIILLSAFEKPDNYNTEKERRSIQSEQETTKHYQQEFINDPTSYENYQ